MKMLFFRVFVIYRAPCRLAMLRSVDSLRWYLSVRFSRLIVSMVLGHFSDSYPKIIEIMTFESRTDNYKVASEILAVFQGSNGFGYAFFGVFSVSVDDEFWSLFLNFYANITNLI